MVPVQSLALEHYGYHYSKYRKRYGFLDDFELHEIERTSVSVEADSVGRYLCTVFEEGDAP